MDLESFVIELGRRQAAQDPALVAALMEQAESSDPVAYALGRAALAASGGDRDGCFAAAEEARLMAPHHPVVLQYVAMAHALLGQLAEAEAAARAAANRDPGPRSAAALGNILLQAGRLDRAEAAFRDALERDPAHVQSLNGLGAIAARLGDNAAALATFARAHAADPTDPTATQSALRLFADAGWALGASALARFTRSGQHPDAVLELVDLVMLTLGRIIARDFPGAADADELVDGAARRLAASATSSPRVQLEHARALFDAGRLVDVRAVVSRLEDERLDAADTGTLAYLQALLADEDGRPDEALERYEESLAADPARWDAACNALNLLLGDQGPEPLVRAAAVLARVDPLLRHTRPQLMLNEAFLLARSGRDREARERLHAVQRVTPPGSELHRLAAEKLQETLS